MTAQPQPEAAKSSTGPHLVSVTGVNKKWATSAIRHLRRRSMLAFYRPVDRSLNTFELAAGREATRAALMTALAETW